MFIKSKEIGSLTVDELWSLHEQVIAVLSDKIREQKRELEKRLSRLKPDAIRKYKADGRGRVEIERPRRRYPKVLPQFRNPDTDETWSGRGKKPRWLIAAVKSGRTKDEFRIAK
jgi:DNA-binding protein H-NS